MDWETKTPKGVQNKAHIDTHSMVEEFMLLANISVAEKVRKSSLKKKFTQGFKRIIQVRIYFPIWESFETYILKVYENWETLRNS